LVIGYLLLKPADEIQPTGAVDIEKSAEESTIISRQQMFNESYTAGPPEKGNWWLGPAQPGQQFIYTSKDGKLIQYLTKGQRDEAVSGAALATLPAATLATSDITEQDLKLFKQELLFNDRQIQTAAGPALLDASQATVVDVNNKQMLNISVTPDPKSVKIPQPALVAALDRLARR